MLKVFQFRFMNSATYFKNFWGLLDFAIIFLIIIAEIILAAFKSNITSLESDEVRMDVELKDKKIRALYAFISLLAWIRVLYYFRIFKATGFYIRMLLQICIDILAFLFILALTIFSFAHVFLIMLKENTQEGAELVNIWGSIRKSYLIVFG